MEQEIDLILEEILNEDSIEQATAAVQYANQMYQNAKKKKLDSIDYWQGRSKEAEKRLATLQKKGETATDEKGLTKKASEIIKSKFEERNKKFFNKVTKDPKNKKAAKVFVKELKDHLTGIAAYKHAKHELHTVKDNLKKAYDLIKADPKEAIKVAGKNSANFLKRTGVAFKNIGIVAKNVYDSAKDLGKKINTKFTDEEKQMMKKDPDGFVDKLTKSLSPQETKDLHTLAKTGAKIGALYMGYGYIQHLGVGAAGAGKIMASSGFSSVLMTNMKAVAGKAFVKHFTKSFKEAIYHSATVAMSLADTHDEHESHVHDTKVHKEAKEYSVDDLLNIYGSMQLISQPYIEMFLDEKMSKAFKEALIKTFEQIAGEEGQANKQEQKSEQNKKDIKENSFIPTKKDHANYLSNLVIGVLKRNDPKFIEPNQDNRTYLNKLMLNFIDGKIDSKNSLEKIKKKFIIDNKEVDSLIINRLELNKKQGLYGKD